MHPLVLVEHLGLALIGLYFVWGGLNHFRIFREVRAMLAERGWPLPGTILVFASLWEAAAGALLASGFHTVWAAGALILFVALANLLLLDFWNQEGEARSASLNGFLVNVAVIGGLVLAIALAKSGV
ncbi:DoxX family membrane protein [Brevundimonas aveniformis]|uniref:DoxX family membrane protein n=1 Tax=Brevundimonas aveniformis TaxID=370977 RepID=UPI0003FC8CAC|nr:DoxX family membrane protein [Brevundimonas aveniformis]